MKGRYVKEVRPCPNSHLHLSGSNVHPSHTHTPMHTHTHTRQTRLAPEGTNGPPLQACADQVKCSRSESHSMRHGHKYSHAQRQ